MAEMLNIETKPFGGKYASVIINLGPPHNTAIDLGTYGSDALRRLAQELERDLDYMEQTAQNLSEGRNSTLE